MPRALLSPWLSRGSQDRAGSLVQCTNKDWGEVAGRHVMTRKGSRHKHSLSMIKWARGVLGEERPSRCPNVNPVPFPEHHVCSAMPECFHTHWRHCSIAAYTIGVSYTTSVSTGSRTSW